MSAMALLTELGRAGIRLEVRGDRLRYWPDWAITADQIERLRDNKTEVLVALRTGNQLYAGWRERSMPDRGRTVFYDATHPKEALIWDEEAASVCGAKHLGYRAKNSMPADPLWPGWLADFVLLLDADDLPEDLRLDVATVVTNRGRFLAAVRADIGRGGSGPRAHVLLAELEQLRSAIFRHHQVSSEEVVSASK